MPKFTLTAEWDKDQTVTHTFDVERLDDAIMCMDQFLRGCGYFYDGQLTIEEEPIRIDLDHNDYYYDTDRNR